MNECQGHKTSSSCLTRDSPNPQLGGDGQRAKGRRVKDAKREKLCFANSCVHWQKPVCVTEFTLTYNTTFSTEAWNGNEMIAAFVFVWAMWYRSPFYWKGHRKWMSESTVRSNDRALWAQLLGHQQILTHTRTQSGNSYRGVICRVSVWNLKLEVITYIVIVTGLCACVYPCSVWPHLQPANVKSRLLHMNNPTKWKYKNNILVEISISKYFAYFARTKILLYSINYFDCIKSRGYNWRFSFVYLLEM